MNTDVSIEFLKSQIAAAYAICYDANADDVHILIDIPHMSRPARAVVASKSGRFPEIFEYSQRIDHSLVKLRDSLSKRLMRRIERLSQARDALLENPILDDDINLIKLSPEVCQERQCQKAIRAFSILHHLDPQRVAIKTLETQQGFEAEIVYLDTMLIDIAMKITKAPSQDEAIAALYDRIAESVVQHARKLNELFTNEKLFVEPETEPVSENKHDYPGVESSIIFAAATMYQTSTVNYFFSETRLSNYNVRLCLMNETRKIVAMGDGSDRPSALSDLQNNLSYKIMSYVENVIEAYNKMPFVQSRSLRVRMQKQTDVTTTPQDDVHRVIQKISIGMQIAASQISIQILSEDPAAWNAIVKVRSAFFVEGKGDNPQQAIQSVIKVLHQRFEEESERNIQKNNFLHDALMK